MNFSNDFDGSDNHIVVDDCDDARSGEWYEEMDDDDIEMIIDYVASECF